MRFDTRRAITACAISVLWLLASASAPAQVSFGTQAGATAATLVEQTEVLANAGDAFRVATGAELLGAHLDGQSANQAREIVANLTERFERDARLLVNELKGDGVLQASEVTEEFSSLRDEYLSQLKRSIAALEAGYPPPPALIDFDTRLAHAIEMAGYTFRIRNEATDWLALAGALLGGVFVAWLIGVVLDKIGARLRRAGKNRTAELTEALEAPVYLAVIAAALYTGFQFLWVPGIAGDMLNRLVDIALVGAVFWFLWNVCETLAQGLGWLLHKTYGKRADRHVTLVVSRALRIVLLVGFVLILVNGVLDSNLTGLIAGLGVIGVALSFVLRGTIQNIAASFTIFGDKPFRVGDLIIHDDQWGRIEDIGFRSTRFRTLAGHLITIPNSQLVDNALHNVGARPSVRRRFRIGLPYDTPPDKVEQAMHILREILDDHRGQPANAPPRVLFEDYGDSALILLVQYNFEPADYWKALEFDSEVNLQIKRRFDEAGISFAFPSRSVYLHAGDDEEFALMRRRPENDEPGEPLSADLAQ